MVRLFQEGKDEQSWPRELYLEFEEIHEVFDLIRDNHTGAQADEYSFLRQAKDVRKDLSMFLRNRKTLLVFDVKEISDRGRALRLAVFIKELIESTSYVKV
jgi:hypothetical protein